MIFGTKQSKLTEHDTDRDLAVHKVLSTELGPLYEKVQAREKKLDAERAEIETETKNFGDTLGRKKFEYSGTHGRKFQYIAVNTQNTEFSINHLDVLGQQSWELVSTSTYTVSSFNSNTWHTQFFFKREILDLPEEQLAELGKEHNEKLMKLTELKAELEKLYSYKQQILERADKIDPIARKLLIKFHTYHEPKRP